MRTYHLILASLCAALAPMAAQASQSSLSGTFEGGYECAQGLTWLKLETNARSDGMMTAFFSFGSAAEKGRTINTVPEGKFAMRGTWNGDHFTLEPDYWIDRPNGFSMVGLTGDVGSRGGLSGDVQFQGCTVFAVRRL
jgi:hypothetical protein